MEGRPAAHEPSVFRGRIRANTTIGPFLAQLTGRGQYLAVFDDCRGPDGTESRSVANHLRRAIGIADENGQGDRVRRAA
jgi:hypothetical protein